MAKRRTCRNAPLTKTEKAALRRVLTKHTKRRGKRKNPRVRLGVIKGGAYVPAIATKTVRGGARKFVVPIPKGKRKGDRFTHGASVYVVVSYVTKTGKRVRFARKVAGGGAFR